MRIKRTTYPPTGIYQRKTIAVELHSDKETYDDLTKLFGHGHQDDHLGLNKMESEAREFLRTYVATEMGGFKEAYQQPGSLEWEVHEHAERQRERLTVELQNHLSQEEKRERTRRLQKVERAADACEILDLICGVRLWLQTQPSCRGAIVAGLQLAEASERFRARRHEPSTFTGSRVLAAASAGGKAAKERTTKEYQPIASVFHLSKLTQRRFLQRHPEISRSKLQRALRANRKPDSNPAK
jgi:hypothetical protein